MTTEKDVSERVPPLFVRVNTTLRDRLAEAQIKIAEETGQANPLSMQAIVPVLLLEALTARGL